MKDLSPLSAAQRCDWLLYDVIDAAKSELRGLPWTPAVLTLMVAIPGQESRIVYRDQVDTGRDVLGPALGLYQFERGGGVKGVLTHPSTQMHAIRACMVRSIRPEADPAWRALKTDDELAVVFARLLLWSDPRAVPSDMEGGWNYYVRNWRPGKPHHATWATHWNNAAAAVARLAAA